MVDQPVVAVGPPSPDPNDLAMLYAGYGPQTAAAPQRSQELAQMLAAMPQGVRTSDASVADRLAEALMQQRFGQSMQDFGAPALSGLDQPSDVLSVASAPAATPGPTYGAPQLQAGVIGKSKVRPDGDFYPADGARYSVPNTTPGHTGLFVPTFDDLFPNRDSPWQHSSWDRGAVAFGDRIGNMVAGHELQDSQTPDLGRQWAAQYATANPVGPLVDPQLMADIQASSGFVDALANGGLSPQDEAYVQSLGSAYPSSGSMASIGGAWNAPPSSATVQQLMGGSGDPADFEAPVVGADPTTHTVQKGDTVHSIARGDPAQIAAIVAANHLALSPVDGSPLIQPRQVLAIPDLTAVDSKTYSALGNAGRNILANNRQGLVALHQQRSLNAFVAELNSIGTRESVNPSYGAANGYFSNSRPTNNHVYTAGIRDLPNLPDNNPWSPGNIFGTLGSYAGNVLNGMFVQGPQNYFRNVNTRSNAGWNLAKENYDTGPEGLAPQLGGLTQYVLSPISGYFDSISSLDPSRPDRGLANAVLTVGGVAAGDPELGLAETSDVMGGAAAEGAAPAAEETLTPTTETFTSSARAATKGYPGVGTTPSGGPTFAGTDYLYPAGEGQSSIVNIKLTGGRRADFDLANKLGGFDGTPEGYTWHHVDDFDPTFGSSTLELIQTGAHRATYPHSGSVIQYEIHYGLPYKR